MAKSIKVHLTIATPINDLVEAEAVLENVNAQEIYRDAIKKGLPLAIEENQTRRNILEINQQMLGV